MIYFGKDAVEKIEDSLRRLLTPKERRVVMLEGYADAPYLDSKKIETTGVGQTGEWLHKSFEEAFAHHEARVIQRLPGYRSFPDYLQCELMQAEYRGDLGISPAACKLINASLYEDAASEFLNNQEYRTAPNQIRRRMEAVTLALKLYGLTR